MLPVRSRTRPDDERAHVACEVSEGVDRGDSRRPPQCRIGYAVGSDQKHETAAMTPQVATVRASEARKGRDAGNRARRERGPRDECRKRRVPATLPGSVGVAAHHHHGDRRGSPRAPRSEGRCATDRTSWFFGEDRRKPERDSVQTHHDAEVNHARAARVSRFGTRPQGDGDGSFGSFELLFLLDSSNQELPSPLR